MTRYLVVAHQTATSPELLRRATELAREDPEATFSILVPATPVQHRWTWEEEETLEVAQRTAVGRGYMGAYILGSVLGAGGRSGGGGFGGGGFSGGGGSFGGGGARGGW